MPNKHLNINLLLRPAPAAVLLWSFWQGDVSAAMRCARPSCLARRHCRPCGLDRFAQLCSCGKLRLAVDFLELKLCDLRCASQCFLAMLNTVSKLTIDLRGRSWSETETHIIYTEVQEGARNK